MKLSKFFLLGTAVALTMSSFSLRAVTPEELAETIRTSRACHAPKRIEQEAPAAEQGWFSSFRKATGNALRTFGDSLRTEGEKSAAGHVKELAKDGFLSTLSAKTGIPFNKAKETIFNSLGNAFRTVGQFVKGGKPVQTTTRVVLDKLDLNKSSKPHQVAQALRTVAQATLQADRATAIEDYRSVVAGLVKRGYATTAQIQSLDVNGIYLDVLAEEELRENAALTYSAFAQAVKSKGFDALENINAVKTAPFAGDKLKAMDSRLQDAYKKIQLQQQFEHNRLKAAAAA